ncbi:MAG: carboxymuconolactone decarboxylase family protein [Gammaproteobacteria bacterium]|nr:carboxymuconolactone decarboxylase family protein [Gammaproteobacteria bacterium]
MNKTAKQTVYYPDRLRNVKKNSQTLAAAQPAVMETFEKFHQAAGATGALDRKIKELMALAISITHGCDDCIAHHVHDAIDAGATREEFADALGVAVLMGGGPGMIYASHAIDAVDQFFERAK